MPSTHRYIAAIATISYRLVDSPWPFASQRAAEIEAHWRKRQSLNPHLFNGRVLLMNGLDPSQAAGEGRIAGTCFLADYKSFLAWRDFGFPDRSVANVFAMAALRSADGAFLVGEMGSWTANAGRIYFPCGTPDPDDLKDDWLDLESSVRRELNEETGLAPDIPGTDLRFDPGWTVVFQLPYVACMKTIRSTCPTTELVARVARFLAGERRPEFARLKPVWSPRDFEAGMPDFMCAYMEHVWRTEIT